MLDFNLDEILEGLEGKSAVEKIKALQELADELEDAEEEVLFAKDEIQDLYKSKILAKVNSAVQAYASKKGITVEISDKSYDIKYEDSLSTILVYPIVEEWNISILSQGKDAAEGKKLAEIARLLDIPYEGETILDQEVSEEELIPRILEIIDILTKHQ